MKLFYLIAIVLCFFHSHIYAHKTHFTIAQGEWNPQTQHFEVALQVDANDLEKALRDLSNKKIRLEDKDIDKWISQYLRQTFIVQVANKPTTFKWVGKEIEVHTLWLYFEFPVAKGIFGAKITNKLFFELPMNNDHYSFSPPQINILNIRQKKQRNSLWFSKDKSEQVVKFGR